jgi:lipooligosaccharide transport system permease protein
LSELRVVGALRVVQRNALVYRRVWRGSLFTSFLQPTLFLTAMGVGLGSRIDAGGAVLPGGVPFLHFLAPGLLAAACMQTAMFESSFPVHHKMVWRRSYDAMSATPLRVADIVAGELAWIGLRLSMVGAAFMAVIALFGVVHSASAVLALPVAVLTGLAFSAPILAYAATLKANGNFNVLFRFVITPLFLFSGVFFPISGLPDWLELLPWLTPLFHGVALTRALTLNTLDSSAWVVHLGYLVAMVAAGTFAAMRTFERKIRT